MEKPLVEENFPKTWDWNLLDKDVTDLALCLGGPQLFFIPGESEQTLFVSVLLHGNEHSSWEILRQALAPFRPANNLQEFSLVLPKNLVIFIGNVVAAALGQRHLKDQPDFNRIWRGHNSEPGRLAAKVVSYLEHLKPIACLDFHNNTGQNPCYSCVSQIDKKTLGLARLFGYRVIHFIAPRDSMTSRLSDIAPSLTLECGLSGDLEGIKAGVKLFQTCLNAKEPWHENPTDSTPIHLYEIIATMRISPGAELTFGHSPSPCEPGVIELRADLEQWNFCEIQPGEVWGYCGSDNLIAIEWCNDIDRPILSRDFDGALKLEAQKPYSPCMLTKNVTVAKSDCLGYLMRRIPKG